MSNETGPAGAAPRDAAYWAPKVERLSVAEEVAAQGYNVAGRRVTGPQQGFGRRFSPPALVRLDGVVQETGVFLPSADEVGLGCWTRVDGATD